MKNMNEPQPKGTHLALVNEDMPDEIAVDGTTWKKVREYKHDFFAATGSYASSDGRKAMLKIYRPNWWYCFPMFLLSYWWVRHEKKVYDTMADTGYTPRFYGRYKKTGMLIEFIESVNLLDKPELDSSFFDTLEEIISTMHERGIAYVDADKPDNFLASLDGRPYVIDFQLTWVQPFFPLSLLTWPIFAILADADKYHIRKHRRRFLRHENLPKYMPWYIRFHRFFSVRFRKFRHRFMPNYH